MLRLCPHWLQPNLKLQEKLSVYLYLIALCCFKRASLNSWGRCCTSFAIPIGFLFFVFCNCVSWMLFLIDLLTTRPASWSGFALFFISAGALRLLYCLPCLHAMLVGLWELQRWDSYLDTLLLQTFFQKNTIAATFFWVLECYCYLCFSPKCLHRLFARVLTSLPDRREWCSPPFLLRMCLKWASALAWRRCQQWWWRARPLRARPRRWKDVLTALGPETS